MAKTVIRDANVSDREAIVRMAKRFVAEVPHYAEFISGPLEQIEKTVDWLLETDTAGLIVADRDGAPIGSISLVLYQHPATGVMMVTEMMWWVDPEHRSGRAGIALLRAAETWALEHGAEALQMVSWNQHLSNFYERFGYREAETVYSKQLGA